MKKTNVRSEYIKKLVAENDDLSSKLEKTTKDVIQSMLDESVRNNLKELISEAEDSDSKEEEGKEAEETTTDETTPENDETTDDTTYTDTEGSEDEYEEELPVGDEESTEEFPMEDGNENNTDDEEMWNSLEQYKDENGEYDLTGMDKENVIKVLKVMKDDDGVRVVKNDNGSITLTDDETDKEYIIDIDGSYDEESGDDNAFEDDNEEYSFEDDGMNESANLGYTDNYQNKTAMTTPSNNEPASSKSTYSMDDGVPTGTEKPFAGDGDKSPYTETVKEECEYEIECDTDDAVNETMTTQEQGAYNRGVGMYHGNTNSKAAVGRNSHQGGSQVKGTGENSYSALEVENIKRKANAIFNENKQLKAIAEKIKNKLEESIVINNSLGKVIKLIAENTTTKEEKINIVKRFNNVKTINEGKELYDTISQELKSNKTTKISNPINETLAESKNNIVETPMYSSDELTETVQLMKRMDKLGKKN